MKYAGRLTLLGCLGAAALLLVTAGCAQSDSSNRDDMSDMYNQQSKALADPFNYSPDMSDTDISGGGTSNFDSKGFDKDANDLANP